MHNAHATYPYCCTQFGMNVAMCHRCVGEKYRQIESCQRPQTTHRVATDLGRSTIRNAQIDGKSLEFLQPLRSKPWWGWDALQSEECRVSCKEMMMTTRKELKSILMINMILTLLVQTLVRWCKTIQQCHRRYFTKFTHQDKS